MAELDEMGLLASHEHPTPRALEWEDLSKLGYLSCVIKAGCPVYLCCKSFLRWMYQMVS